VAADLYAAEKSGKMKIVMANIGINEIWRKVINNIGVAWHNQSNNGENNLRNEIMAAEMK
jgi:hypothetical protein